MRRQVFPHPPVDARGFDHHFVRIIKGRDAIPSWAGWSCTHRLRRRRVSSSGRVVGRERLLVVVHDLAEVTGPVTAASTTPLSSPFVMLLLGTTESKLASIIIPGRLDKWSSMKLDDGHPLTQFHSKFWGKSMETEERQWRNAQGDPSNIEPGCYALDIGIPGILVDKMWIRAEYLEIYDYFEDYYYKTEGLGRCPGGVLTGQPGIGECTWFIIVSLLLRFRRGCKGKSMWIYYAIRRRIGERKPVIWYWQQTLRLFVEEGVYESPPDFELFWLKYITWTMVDSNTGIPRQLIPHDTSLFVIYITPPAKQRWSRMDKTVVPTVAVMNPWTREEIYQASAVFFSHITSC